MSFTTMYYNINKYYAFVVNTNLTKCRDFKVTKYTYY